MNSPHPSPPAGPQPSLAPVPWGDYTEPILPGADPDPALPPPNFATDSFRPAHIPSCSIPVARRRGWRKRRFWGALAASLLATAILLTAICRGQQTRIFFINQSSEPLPSLTVSAAGHTHSVPVLDGEASHRWVLPSGGSAAPVVIFSNSSSGATWNWEGPVIDPDSASRLILHIWPDGTVEESNSSSFWFDLLHF